MTTCNKDNEKWKKINSLGMVRFVFLYGLLGFGLMTTIISFFIQRILVYGFDLSNVLDSGWEKVLFESLVQWTLTGIVWGTLMWVFFVKRLSKRN